MRELRPLGSNKPKAVQTKETASKVSESKNSRHELANATGVFKKWGRARPGVGKPPRNVHTKPIFSSTTANFSSVNKFFSKDAPKLGKAQKHPKYKSPEIPENAGSQFNPND